MLPRQLGSIFGSILDVGTIEPETSLDVNGGADENATDQAVRPPVFELSQLMITCCWV